MRRTRILTAVLAAGSAKVAIAADTYTWKNARIDGGGFVPGIVFNRTEKNLAYARTDIGGAYRCQEPTKTWTPLLDSIGWDDWGHTGVVSLASDSVDPDNERPDDLAAVERRAHAVGFGRDRGERRLERQCGGGLVGEARLHRHLVGDERETCLVQAG